MNPKSQPSPKNYIDTEATEPVEIDITPYDDIQQAVTLLEELLFNGGMGTAQLYTWFVNQRINIHTIKDTLEQSL